jgi:hypothetical protein
MTEEQNVLLKELASLWDKINSSMTTTIDSYLSRQGLEEREFDILSLEKRAQVVWQELVDSQLSRAQINDEVNKIRNINE